MAAEQIGKAQNHEQLQKTLTRCVKNLARLEVPGRLKLAIQQVLDQTAPHHDPFSAFGYEDYYDAVRPSISSEDGAATQSWADITTGYDQPQNAAMDYYSGSYVYPGYEIAATSTSEQYNYDVPESATSPPSYEESYAANHDSYYNNASGNETSSYSESGAAATTLLSLQSSGDQALLDESDIVEAHVVAEVAEECVEGELAPDQPPSAEPVNCPQLDMSDTVGTWSCGQCTFMNPMTSSFCEMCTGHISLSPDVKTTAGTSVSASLLVPAKPVVDVVMSLPRVKSPTDATVTPQSHCMLPPLASLYSPSAPDYEISELCEDEQVNASPLPPPPPYPGTSSCGNVDFLALAFSGSSAPKQQATEPSSAVKASQMRREETTTTEYTF
ncbi:unnamed protein product [Phytophthora fragariaefolia]|uniref:Unnamed protein product n=1 Tax=Phytophthora fragariaefolia TaxID=1490495 RepID=A0A9W6XFL2_9STRA|nr:unnamed protein product [Phytophthora fragariaefolia]